MGCVICAKAAQKRGVKKGSRQLESFGFSSPVLLVASWSKKKKKGFSDL